MLGDIAEFIKKHPELMGLAIIAVALIAYMQSRDSGGSGVPADDVTFTGGGVTARPVDPGVVAIEQSRIEAGSRNIGTIASFLLGSQQSTDSLSAVRAQTDAALTADLERTRQGAKVEMSRISADLTSNLARTAAEVDIAAGSNATQISLAGIYSSASLEAAKISAAIQDAITESNIRLAELSNARQLEINATQRDVARVEAKSNFWGDAFGLVGDVVENLNPFNWFD